MVEMSPTLEDDVKFSSASTSHSGRIPTPSHSSSHSSSKHGNIFGLLARREISPQPKQFNGGFGEEKLLKRASFDGLRCEASNVRRALISWVEAESLNHLSAKYCPLVPSPRSTIAAAFSPDGETLASTHGDHTVKIIDCRTGNCLKVLSGHRRTPWVVRFHPLCPDILASGSLDHVVHLWNSKTAYCMGSHDFGRPIASIAFHAQGELLAVASGHKLYIWSYNKRGESSTPAIVLKTRRSLRAVHFHPHGAPFLLTAEVNDIGSSDSSLTLATSPGYLQYPPPAVFFACIDGSFRQYLEAKVPLLPPPYFFWPQIINNFRTQGGRPSGFPGTERQDVETFLPLAQRRFQGNQIQCDQSATSMDISPGEPSNSSLMAEYASLDFSNRELGTEASASLRQRDIIETQLVPGLPERASTATSGRPDTLIHMPMISGNEISVQLPTQQSRQDVDVASNISSNFFNGAELLVNLRSLDSSQLHQLIPSQDPFSEMPFLQGWLMGQTHSSLANSSLQENSDPASSSRASAGPPRIARRFGSRHRSSSHLVTSSGAREGFAHQLSQIDETEPLASSNIVLNEIPTSTTTSAAELPCTVKLRIWAHNLEDPCAPLDPASCHLTIPHAVLCSEMGAHFSPCGRFLVACVACLLPQTEGDPGAQSQMQADATAAATSPTRHPFSTHQVIYELRVYSLEGATFGMVLSSRAIRAAHCLTSIQFSPTSEHILLAYGRRHGSLLRSVVMDGETTIPVYTILEIYRVSDMELVKVLPSVEDEVNVACFHPSVGGGLVYGTKEGKLRILQYDGQHEISCMGPNIFLDQPILEGCLFLKQLEGIQCRFDL